MSNAGITVLFGLLAGFFILVISLNQDFFFSNPLAWTPLVFFGVMEYFFFGRWYQERVDAEEKIK